MFDFLQTDPIAFTVPFPEFTLFGIQFGPFDVFWYGIIVTLGIALGAAWAGRELIIRAKGDVAARGEDPEDEKFAPYYEKLTNDFYNGLLLVVIAGYVFARGWYVLQEVIAGRGGQYDSLIDVLNIRAGGANILGGFVGAAVVGLLYVRWRKIDFLRYADLAGPALLIAQAIGRWGNLINQELYGPPTDAPWGILIEVPNRIAPFNDINTYPPDTRFHPTFFYEFLWLLAGFILLVYLNNRFRESWRSGTLFGAFLIWWGGGRTWIEFFRPDQPTFGDGPITYSMVFALLLALSGVLFLLWRYDKLPETGRARRRRSRRVRKPKPRRATKDGKK